MQDLSRVTGNQLVIAGFKGQDWTVNGFTFEDIGLLQGEMLKRKRKTLMEAAAAVREFLPAEESDRHIRQATKDASEIQYVTEDEVNNFIRTPDGMLMLVGVLLNRQYPGKFSRADITELFATEKLRAENIEPLFAAFRGDAGNATGPSSPAGAV